MNKIDVHAHCGFIFFPIVPLNPTGLIDNMDRYGIDLAMVSNIDGLFYDYTDCNRLMFEAIAPFSTRLKGYVVVNPNYLDDSLAQIEYYSKLPQCCGVKLHASWHNKAIDSAAFRPLFELCQQLDLPILVHSYVVDDYQDQVSCPERVANAASRYENQIILAHMGGNAQRTIRAIKECSNISIDISCGREKASQLYVWEYNRINEAVAALGAERIVYGTDFPLLDISICNGMIADSSLTQNEIESIQYKNACRIFKLDPAI